MGIVRTAFRQAMTEAGFAPDSGTPGAAPAAPASAAVPTAFREAAGATVDADDASWKRLTGRTDKDLDPLTHARAGKLAQHLWQSNPLANRLIELPLAYLLGKGVNLKSNDADAQKVLDRHWRDCINAWPIKLPKRIRELSLFGEQCWRTFVGDNGFVRVGYLDPDRIGTVVMDPDNGEQPIGIVTKTDRQGKTQRFRCIVNGPESVFTPRTQEIRQTFVDGDCFYFRINDLCNGQRGRGDLVPLLDWLDAYDEFLFGEMERADFMRAFVWDVELTGASQEDVDLRASKMTAPRPGATRVHNENEKWNAVTPELQASDGSVAARLFRNNILGGNTVPEHWFGGAADVNRATGESMAEPTEKVFEMRQAYLGHMLVEVATYVLRAEWQVLNDQDLSEQRKVIIDGLAVEWPGMTTKDIAKYAAALQQVITAATDALDVGLISEATALSIIGTVATQLGVDIDVEAELIAAKQDLEVRGGSTQDLLRKPAPVNPDDATQTIDDTSPEGVPVPAVA